MTFKIDVSLPICSFELAKELNEIGFKEFSTFYYLPSVNPNSSKPSIGIKGSFDEMYRHDAIRAYTSSELIEFLPNTITIKENEPFNNFRLFIRKLLLVPEDKVITHYGINYECDTFDPSDPLPFLPVTLFKHHIIDQNFSNALAKTLLHIIKSEYTKFI